MLNTQIVLEPDWAAMGEAAKLFTRSVLMGLDSAVRKSEFAEPTAEDIENMPYTEAVEFLKKRDVITKIDYNKLSDKMRFRAFTVSRINDGKLLERIKNEMAANVRDGKGLKDFLALTKTDILDKVGMGPNQGWYWEVVYRTNVQTAYGAGRAMGFEEDRPLALEFIGIDDSRQTEICHSLMGMVRPYDDPFWKSHWTPMHFGCRSTIRAIYNKDELPEDWSSLDGAEKPAKGFGSYPLHKDDWWDELESQVRQAKQFGVQGEIEAAKEILINNEAPKENKFINADNIESANKYATETLGIARADYKGLPLEVANEWNKGLYENFKRFPELKERFGFVGECHAQKAAMKKQFFELNRETVFSGLRKLNPGISDKTLEPYVDKVLSKNWRKLTKDLKISRNTIALSFSDPQDFWKDFNGITVNKDVVKNYQSFLKRKEVDVASKFHPVGTAKSLKADLDHEIGHQLDTMLDLRKDSVILNLWNELSDDEITDGLSRYAWDNSSKEKIKEFIAEGWSEYCNNPSPRPIAKKIGDRILEVYKAWKK